MIHPLYRRRVGIICFNAGIKTTLGKIQRVLKQAEAGGLNEIEPNTFVDDSTTPDLADDAFLPHHYCDEAEVRDLMTGFDLIDVYADLPDQRDENGLARRGYWVATAKKP